MNHSGGRKLAVVACEGRSALELTCAVCLEDRLKELKRQFPGGVPDAEIYRAFDSSSPARATTMHGRALCMKHILEDWGVKRTTESVHKQQKPPNA